MANPLHQAVGEPSQHGDHTGLVVKFDRPRSHHHRPAHERGVEQAHGNGVGQRLLEERQLGLARVARVQGGHAREQLRAADAGDAAAECSRYLQGMKVRGGGGGGRET